MTVKAAVCVSGHDSIGDILSCFDGVSDVIRYVSAYVYIVHMENSISIWSYYAVCYKLFLVCCGVPTASWEEMPVSVCVSLYWHADQGE